jgi:hypothetical protein
VVRGIAFVFAAFLFGWLLRAYEPIDATSRVLVCVLALVCFLQAIVLLMLIAPDQPAKNEYSPDDRASSDDKRDTSGPSRVLLKIRDRFKAYREKANNPEYRRERREWLTVLILLLAAGFALLQWDALIKTDNHIDGQLEVMKTESDYRRYELAANMQLKIDSHGIPGGWNVNTVWEDVGKTDALNVTGWIDLKFVPREKINSTNFFDMPDGKQLYAKETVVPGDKVIYKTMRVGLSEALDPINSTPVIFGYIEYNDIFETSHTVHFCRALDFTFNGQILTMNLPSKLSLPMRTQD